MPPLIAGHRPGYPERAIVDSLVCMYFSKESLEILEADYKKILGKYHKLLKAYAIRVYVNEQAKENATHGFIRRLGTLSRCINNVFTILPPEYSTLPNRDKLSDAAINIQAFVINIFGTIDNLAWIWVYETNLTQDDGLPIPKEWVGLGSKNKIIRSSFSQGFQNHLEDMDSWFDVIGNLRHSLAHRIPLYIPPYTISSAQFEAYNNFENKKNAAFASWDINEHDELTAEQQKLTKFKPWISGSIGDNPRPIVFHAQLLNDFITIEDLAWKILEELKR